MEQATDYSDLEKQLRDKKTELTARLERINQNVRRGLDTDSEERAQQLEDQEVVDALGNEAREELVKVTEALERLSTGRFGICQECGAAIRPKRLVAYPHAEYCFQCAAAER